VQVARGIDALEHVAEEAGDVVDVEVGSSSCAQIQRYLARLSWFLPRMWFAMVRISCGRRSSQERRVALAADGEQQRVHAGGVDRVHGVQPGISCGIAEPVSSWISAPKLVSSCGGRPTTVNGQIASRRW
jgi:hypothetical protein